MPITQSAGDPRRPKGRFVCPQQKLLNLLVGFFDFFILGILGAFEIVTRRNLCGFYLNNKMPHIITS